MHEAIELITPDLIMTGLLFLAAGMLVRVRSATSRGNVVGFGYFDSYVFGGLLLFRCRRRGQDPIGESHHVKWVMKGGQTVMD
jgi:hypothetical protein